MMIDFRDWIALACCVFMGVGFLAYLWERNK